MEVVQTHLGSATPFWDLDYRTHQHLAPKGWIKHTWAALDESPLRLRGPLEVLPPLRDGDVHLMDAFIRDPELCKEQHIHLQNIRFHLGVTRLSEISTVNGSHIQLAYWNGQIPPHRVRRSRLWPRSYRPSSNDWDLWRTSLQRNFGHDTQERKLRRQMGAWTQDKDPIWEWWHCSVSDSVWKHGTTGWQCWPRDPLSPRQRYKHDNQVTSAPPAALHRIDI